MKKKKLVLFQGHLNTIDLFSDQLKTGLLQVGDYEIFEFNLQDKVKGMGGLYNFLQGEPVTAMIGFNSTFFGVKLPSGLNMCEQLGIPCINILVDHPYWYPEVLQQMPSTGIVLCVDRRHMNFVNRFYSQIGVNGFLPHGGVPMKARPKPIVERGIDVIYAGSLFAEYISGQKADFSKWEFDAEQVCEEAIQRLLDEPDNTIEYVLEELLVKRGIEMFDSKLCRFVNDCVYIERVVGSYYREKILACVARAGVKLELYGDGWGQCDWVNLPNVYYGGRISPMEVLEKMEDAKIVLNTMPWFKDGSHERVFNGMLRGAVVCSDTSGYLNEVVPSDAWEPFELKTQALAVLSERIISLLQAPDRMQKIATAGYEFAIAGHTWQHRAEELHEDLLSLL